MHNDETSDFIAPLKNLQLGSDVKARIRANLFAYADFNPVMARPASRVEHFNIFVGRFSYAVGAFFLIGGWGVAYAAHSALPGNPLYSLKIALLEPVEHALLPEETSAEWSLTLANRRLAEAEMITSRSDATKTAEVQAAVEVANAARAVQKNIDALASAAAKAKATEAFNLALVAHENTLQRLAVVASTTALSSPGDPSNPIVSVALTLDNLFVTTKTRAMKTAALTGEDTAGSGITAAKAAVPTIMSATSLHASTTATTTTATTTSNTASSTSGNMKSNSTTTSNTQTNAGTTSAGTSANTTSTVSVPPVTVTVPSTPVTPPIHVGL